MPYSLTVSPAAELGEVRLAGRVTGDEIAAAAAELAARPDWQGHFRVIWDTSDQVGLDIPVETFEGILEQERQLVDEGESGELVFVVTDVVWAGLVTLFRRKMRDDARTITVVPTRAAALAHLGIAAD